MSSHPRLTIIGAGATGVLIAHFLKSKFNYGSAIRLVDKSNRVGGRMATTRIKSSLDGKYSFLNYGLQYLSFNSKELSEIQQEVVSELEQHKIIEKYPMPPGSNEPKQYKKENYYRPIKSNQDILDFYLPKTDSSQVSFEFSKKLENLDEFSEADLVVSTAPIPQIVNLCRNSKNDEIKNSQVLSDISQVKYLARYCYGMVVSKSFYESVIKNNSTTKFNEYMYFTKEINDKIAYIRFIEDLEPNNPDSDLKDRVGVMLHGRAFLVVDNDKGSKLNKDSAGEEIHFEFCRLFGLRYDGRESKSYKENFHGGKGHKWLYSKPLLDEGGPTFDKKFLEIGSENGPKLLVTGEAFGKEGNFLNCIEAAYATAKRIAGN